MGNILKVSDDLAHQPPINQRKKLTYLLAFCGRSKFPFDLNLNLASYNSFKDVNSRLSTPNFERNKFITIQANNSSIKGQRLLLTRSTFFWPNMERKEKKLDAWLRVTTCSMHALSI